MSSAGTYLQDPEHLFCQIIQGVHSSLDGQEIVDIFANELGRFLQADRCYISLLREGRLCPPLSEFRSQPAITSLLELPKVHWEGLSRITQGLCDEQKLLIQDKQTWETRALDDGQNRTGDIIPLTSEERNLLQVSDSQASVIAPVTWQDKCIGVFFVQQVTRPRVWTEHEKQLLRIIAQEAGISLNQSLLYKELKEAYHQLEATHRIIQEQNDQLEMFSAKVAHDLKSPLRKISMFTNLLINTDEKHTQQEYKQRIDNSIERLTHFIDELLDTSKEKQNAGGGTLMPLPVVLHRVLDDLQMDIHARNAHVIVEGECDLEVGSIQYYQVLYNLIENGLKYNDKDEPEIKINCVQEESKIHLMVSDNGIGIAPKNYERIFRSFERLHDKRYPGTGFGLYICREIVHNLGGDISVESTPGQGSTFHIKVPMEKH